MKDGDTVNNSQLGLTGKLVVSDDKKAIHSLDTDENRWHIRAHSVADLRQAGWRKI
ncbi:hypothetical protein WAK64_04255 [Bacillus spongiae]|uniref:Uncharacterized protein n=1 Tax=Bacillus spongiae TaxID=2683610 RepID=A0ABU8HAT1_9BACI